MVTDTKKDKTELGNYFIANYPPFSFWKKDKVGAIQEAFETIPAEDVPLGLYLHIPFCRKRCKFCYFRVYTDVNAAAIQEYVDSLASEIELLATKRAIEGRTIRFVYFGGGTPSYLAAKQLRGLVERLRQHINWDDAEEVTFECEPGTLSESKLEALKEIGVTRLSLGVENFSDAVLEENGRAHLSGEIYRAWDWIKAIGFDQVNIDLISGMVGETQENWEDCVQRTIDLAPDSVTIYQMELPYNTRYANELSILNQPGSVADWSTKRRWVEEAFAALEKAGYHVGSAYTAVKDSKKTGFLYRDNLWHGADLLGTGVASFGHLSGVHYQNVDGLENYQGMLAEKKLPLGRALPINAEEALIREMILQMKLGWLDAGYFRQKFGREIFSDFAEEFGEITQSGYGSIDGDRLQLNRDGLLRVDSMLPPFFLPEHRADRYT
ncbi:Oxygen-independent coproporphyrinogen-III oxidase 1 [Planctomycetes bacterium Pan216]|uniref:Oxygen-independent coproporphyrinogen-III oxidase 1 n=1 Tax=Kolteria novifilia TaxID=2527975 RepID=A0A518B323_9BACT|nr:Oxygen-independent coproporphyrinogen-III oxidase 1 [Planctomycetes bacterium Pan216]